MIRGLEAGKCFAFERIERAKTIDCNRLIRSTLTPRALLKNRRFLLENAGKTFGITKNGFLVQQPCREQDWSQLGELQH